MISFKEFLREDFSSRMNKVQNLANNPGTPGEGQAAQNILNKMKTNIKPISLHSSGITADLSSHHANSLTQNANSADSHFNAARAHFDSFLKHSVLSTNYDKGNLSPRTEYHSKMASQHSEFNKFHLNKSFNPEKSISSPTPIEPITPKPSFVSSVKSGVESLVDDVAESL